jgi:hypothetical protein
VLGDVKSTFYIVVEIVDITLPCGNLRKTGKCFGIDHLKDLVLNSLGLNTHVSPRQKGENKHNMTFG